MSGYNVVKHAGNWSIKYYDGSGKRKYKKLFSKNGDIAPSRQTKKIAEVRAAEWFQENGPVQTSGKGLDIKSLFAHFHKDPGVPKGGRTILSKASIRMRTDNLTAFQEYLHNSVGLNPHDSAQKITPALVNGFLDLRAKDLNANSLKRVLCTLKRAFNYAVETEVLASSPVKRRITQTSKATKEKAILNKAWTEDQYNKLRALPKKQWVDLLLVICWEAGLRPHEAMNLRNSDFDHDAGVIHVTEGREEDGRNGIVLKTGERTVPLSLKLSKYVSNLDIESILGPVTPNAKNQAIRKLCNKAGVKQKLYGARHAFCLRLARKGAPIHALRKIMGHSSIQTTQIYLDAIDTADLSKLKSILDE